MAIMAVNKMNTFVRLSGVEANFCMMKNFKLYILFYLFLCLFVVEAEGQIVDLDSIKSDYFNGYDVVFIGEKHNVYNKSEIEIKLLNLILKDSFSICLEQDFTFNIPNQIVYLKQDTSFYTLRTKNFEEKLYRYFYNKKVPIRAIDVIWPESVLKIEILKLYESKIQDSIVKSDMKFFKGIGKMKFPLIYKNSEKYGSFLDSVKKHRLSHEMVLGADTSMAFDFFDALEKGLYTFHDHSAPHSQMASVYRENFMLKMISREINKHQKVISINGYFHISMEGKEMHVKNSNWTPLATLVKNNYSDKKICSIIFLQPENDWFFKKYYPKELEYISDSTKLNKTYIINIDYPNSPFKNLIGKYTHIVVF